MPGLPLGSATDWRREGGGGASTAGIYFCTVLDAGSLILRYEQSGFLLSHLFMRTLVMLD